MNVAALDAVEGSFDNQDEEDEAADLHAAEVLPIAHSASVDCTVAHTQYQTAAQRK